MFRDTSAQDRPIAAARRPRWIAPLLLALAAGAGLLWAWPALQQRLASGPSVSLARLQIAEVGWGPLTRDIAAEGKVVAAASPTLYASQPGIVRLAVRAGDAVEAGQVLLTIDSPELQAQLAQERANEQALQAEAGRAEAAARQQQAQAAASLENARIAQQAAQLELRRQSQAFEAGATAGVQVDLARDSLARAEVALRQARELAALQQEAGRHELAAKQQAWQRQRLLVAELARQQQQLAVRSPVKGQVGQLFVEERMQVGRDARLASVIDLSQLELQVQVAESQARELQLGMGGEISGGGGQRWQGRISAISPEVVNNEVAARLRFEGSTPEQLRQNQRLSVRILLEQRERVLGVARGSFVEQGGGRQAYRLRDGVAEKVALRLGAQSLSRVEVLEGAAAGDRLVVGGAEAFDGAQRVLVAQ